MSPRRKIIGAYTVKDRVAELDQAIRDGKSAQVRKELLQFSNVKLPRQYLVELASLARRAEVPDLGLKFLGPIVRSSKPLLDPPHQDEKAEYAANLIKIGAMTEARELLLKLNPAECPEAQLYLAYAAISNWDYEGSIPQLEAYIKNARGNSYLKFVARVNLASSLTFERRHEEAFRLIDSLLTEAKEKKFVLLQGNLLELRAQNAVQSREWSEAKVSLAEAEKILNETGARFGLFVQKWKVLGALLKDGHTEALTKQLSFIKQEALSLRHWETLRDCDRVFALVTRDEALAQYLFFGSPFPSFRERLLKDWKKDIGSELAIPEFFNWSPSVKKGKPRVLDLSSGKLDNSEEEMRPAGVIHLLMSALCSDFYRPQRLACLFSALYPGQFYSNQTANLRVHQVANRLRSWIKSNELSLLIEETDGFYQLIAKECFQIRVPRPDRSRVDPAMAQIRNHFPPGTSFTAKELADILEISPSSALRFVKSLVEGGAAQRQGSGSQVRYSLVKLLSSDSKAKIKAA